MASAVFVACWACLEFGVHADLPVALEWAILPFSVVLALCGVWVVSVRRNVGKNRVLPGATRVVQSQQASDKAQKLPGGRDLRFNGENMYNQPQQAGPNSANVDRDLICYSVLAYSPAG